MEIKETLKKLEELYSGWDISTNKWFLTMGWALRLQGYDTKKEIRVLDTGISRDAWPWQLREIYEDLPAIFMIPPKDSKELEEYEIFMKDTGYSLSTHVVNNPKLFETPTIEYVVSEEKIINLHDIPSIVRLNDFLVGFKRSCGECEDPEKHLDYIQEIKFMAQEKKDFDVVEICEEILPKYSYLIFR